MHVLNDYGFTQQEIKVLELVVKGYSNKTISDKLNLNENIINVTLGKIIEKMKVCNRIQIIVKALKEKLI